MGFDEAMLFVDFALRKKYYLNCGAKVSTLAL